MSTILLCLLISNCSLASLLTKVDLLTVTFSILVGSGIGPTTIAQESFAVSTIFFTASSMSLCSNALTTILIFPVFFADICIKNYKLGITNYKFIFCKEDYSSLQIYDSIINSSL